MTSLQRLVPLCRSKLPSSPGALSFLAEKTFGTGNASNAANFSDKARSTGARRLSLLSGPRSRQSGVVSLHSTPFHSPALFSQNRRSFVFTSPSPDVEIPEVDLFSAARRRYRENMDGVVFVDYESKRSWTAGEVLQSSEAAAASLAELGFRAGDRLLIFSANRPEYAVVCYAAWALGGVVTPANSSYVAAELEAQASSSFARFLACDLDRLPTAKSVFAVSSSLDRLIVLDADDDFVLDDATTTTTTTLRALIRSGGGSAAALLTAPPVNPGVDAAFLPFSSGTTGAPKGVVLTHANVVANHRQMRSEEYAVARKGEYLLGLLPFYHTYGLSILMTGATLAGACLVTVPSFEPESFLRITQDYKIRLLHVVPPLAIFLAKHPLVDKFDLSSVQTLFCGAAPLSKETETLLRRRLGDLEIRQGYGLSETTVLTIVPAKLAETRPGSVGVPIPNTRLKIVDPESGAALSEGAEGEIRAKGPQVMTGYLGAEESGSAFDEEGWFRTGDVGRFEDGHLYITDRLKEMIKYKGHAVAPASLEALILTHPDVADVAVIGVNASEDVGETPKAFVVLKSGVKLMEDEVEKFVEGKASPFTWLRGGVEFVEEIPKSASGKILRKVLRERERERVREKGESERGLEGRRKE